MFVKLADKIMDTIEEARSNLNKEEFEEFLEGLQDAIEEMKGE